MQRNAKVYVYHHQTVQAVLLHILDSTQISVQYSQFASFQCVEEPDLFAASQADMGVRIQRVVVAMETVNNPAAYTGSLTSVHAPIKAF